MYLSGDYIYEARINKSDYGLSTAGRPARAGKVLRVAQPSARQTNVLQEDRKRRKVLLPAAVQPSQETLSFREIVPCIPACFVFTKSAYLPLVDLSIRVVRVDNENR